MAVANFAVLTRIYKLSSGKKASGLSVTTTGLFSLIWFSPVQAENWLWGWQLQWFLSVFGVLVAFHGLAKLPNMNRREFVIMIMGAVLAHYSLGSGIIVWPLLTLGLLFLKAPNKKVFTLIGIASASIIFDFATQADKPLVAPRTIFLEEPVNFMRYILTYLGRPIYFEGLIPPIAGLIIVTIFFGSIVIVFKKYKKRVSAITPWIALGLYAIGSATVTAVSRLGLGLDQAFTSRYTTISSLLLVSTMAIVLLNKDILVAQYVKKRRVKLVSISTSAVLGAFVLANAAWGIRWMMVHRATMVSIRTCTIIDNPTADCLRLTYPDPDNIKDRLHYLKAIKWGGY